MKIFNNEELVERTHHLLQTLEQVKQYTSKIGIERFFFINIRLKNKQQVFLKSYECCNQKLIITFYTYAN